MSWISRNEAYLETRLAELRARLVERIEQSTEPASSGATATVELRGKKANIDPGDERSVPAALRILAERLGLSSFEEDLLLLCAAVELDPAVPDLLARLQPSGRPVPTFLLAMAVLDDPAWDVLSPERPLRRFRLIEIHRPAGTPLIQAGLRAEERVVNWIKGIDHLDDRLAPFLTHVRAPENRGKLPSSQQETVKEIVSHLASSSPDEILPVIQLLGGDSRTKQTIAAEVAAACRLELHRLSAEFLPMDSGELQTLMWLWERERRLMPLSLILEAGDRGADQSRHAAPRERFLMRAGGLLFLDVSEPAVLSGRRTIAFEVNKPTGAEQRSLWESQLGPDSDQLSSRLAGQFSLDADAIVEISNRADDEDADRADRIWMACRRHARPRLDSLARRIDAKATWDDLVLPESESDLLRSIAAQVGQRCRVHNDWGFGARQNRGLGIAVLFAGESGTGKTMAAEVLANALALDLYRVDLSAMVSKYVGETEKNLRRVFDAAEDGGMILFFDEADALFGKRSEVKDSMDRFANQEVGYLLQRMETYRGLAILATNMKSEMDGAFLRRLRFVVNFPVPTIEQRREIWQRAFPPQTPLRALDYERLARLSLTGGNIHTVAVNAALASAGNGGEVDMPHILRAARAEFRKLQKPINAADFRWTETSGGHG